MKLRPREIELLCLLCDGHGIESAAATMEMSYQSAKNQLAFARERNCTNTHAPVAYAAVTYWKKETT